LQSGNGARSTQNHFPHSCDPLGPGARGVCHCGVPLPNRVLEALGYKAGQTGHPPQPIPSPRALLLPPSALRPPPACPLTYTKPSVYIGMSLKIKVCPTLVPALVAPLNALVCLQSEKPIRNGPCKPTQIVFQQSRKKLQRMSFEWSFLSTHPLCYVAHS
jgi:hypothetical protein